MKPTTTKLGLSGSLIVAFSFYQLVMWAYALNTGDRDLMGTFFIVLSHVVTVLGILALSYGAYVAIVSTNSVPERIVCGIALVTGTFAYMAAKALGLSLPSLIVNSVEAGQWLSLLFIGAIIPSLTAFFLIRYIMQCMKRSDVIAIRVMLLISALVLVMFSDVYIAAANEAKLDSMRPLLPNVTFLLTMMCYIIFEYRPKECEPVLAAIKEEPNDQNSP